MQYKCEMNRLDILHFQNALRQTVQTLIGDTEFWTVFMQEKKLEEEATLERQRKDSERNHKRRGKKNRYSSS